ncbi:hypothetical protein [Parachitinimonas caeni]|uniref:Zonular occludens toxin Zot n=1 Tax=Parachitinimonas caeni TaxID=3031301 RepID=A0ABT7E1R9_9NEIS|nr:hypothetical protein [Parachitinimonas caeni]MDK2126258.1 hypothetical protein [Parachitinimonas caeni]
MNTISPNHPTPPTPVPVEPESGCLMFGTARAGKTRLAEDIVLRQTYQDLSSAQQSVNGLSPTDPYLDP